MSNPCAVQLEVENKLESLRELHTQLQKLLGEEKKQQALTKKLEHKQTSDGKDAQNFRRDKLERTHKETSSRSKENQQEKEARKHERVMK